MYYTRVEGIVYGPYTEQVLRGYIAEGRIIPESEISIDGENWYTAREFPGLFAALGDYPIGMGETTIGALQAKKVSLFSLFIGCWKKFATIQGRAGRREFVAWFLFNTAIAFLIAIVSFSIAERNGIDISQQIQTIVIVGTSAEQMDTIQPLLPYLLPLITYGIIALLPNFCVTIRRLHDLNLSGWWYILLLLLARVPLVGYFPQFLLLFIPGTPRNNRFGPRQ